MGNSINLNVFAPLQTGLTRDPRCLRFCPSGHPEGTSGGRAIRGDCLPNPQEGGIGPGEDFNMVNGKGISRDSAFNSLNDQGIRRTSTFNSTKDEFNRPDSGFLSINAAFTSTGAMITSPDGAPSTCPHRTTSIARRHLRYHLEVTRSRGKGILSLKADPLAPRARNARRARRQAFLPHRPGTEELRGWSIQNPKERRNTMAKNETVRRSPALMREDTQAYTALLSLEDYQPANPANSKESLTQLYQVMLEAAETEVNAANTMATARDTVVAAEWDFHNARLGVTAQVIAQYGHDSDEVQTHGLKKKSEHRRPSRPAD
mgnify:CR=1 FL=1